MHRILTVVFLTLSVASASAAPDVTAIDHARILKAAEAALTLEPLTITAFRAELSEGGPNDFYSNGDYWWPDPKKPDGLPYIRRDGESNPGNFTAHRNCVNQLRDVIAALGAAYRVTGEDRYAEKSADLLRVFFLDPDTRMDPHLNFAQAIPGRTPGRGIGIIDTLHLIEIPPASRRFCSPGWRWTSRATSISGNASNPIPPAPKCAGTSRSPSRCCG